MTTPWSRLFNRTKLGEFFMLTLWHDYPPLFLVSCGFMCGLDCAMPAKTGPDCSRLYFLHVGWLLVLGAALLLPFVYSSPLNRSQAGLSNVRNESLARAILLTCLYKMDIYARGYRGLTILPSCTRNLSPAEKMLLRSDNLPTSIGWNRKTNKTYIPPRSAVPVRTDQCHT